MTKNPKNKSLLIIGMGYVGLRLAKHFSSEGWAIASTSRKKEKITSMKHQNWQPFFWNQEFIINFKKSAFIPDAIIVTVPPENNKSDPIFPILKPYLDEFKGWLGYISSTSVYASSNGEKTFENSPTIPNTARGIERLNAENLWKSLDAEIFRVAGIYGPHRSPFEKIRNKKDLRIINKNKHLFNRIHIDDLTSIISFAVNNAEKKRIMNLADGNPCSQVDYYKEASIISKLKIPPVVDYEKAILSDKMRSFWEGWKYIIPKVLQEDLGYEFKYSNYREGLKQIWEEENNIA